MIEDQKFKKINEKNIINLIPDWCICYEALKLDNHLMCPSWGVLWCIDWIKKHWNKSKNTWTHCKVGIKIDKLLSNINRKKAENKIHQ